MVPSLRLSRPRPPASRSRRPMARAATQNVAPGAAHNRPSPPIRGPGPRVADQGWGDGQHPHRRARFGSKLGLPLRSRLAPASRRAPQLVDTGGRPNTGGTAYRVVARIPDLPIQPRRQVWITTRFATPQPAGTAAASWPHPVKTGDRPNTGRTAYKVVARILDLPVQPPRRVRITARGVADQPSGTAIQPCLQSGKTDVSPRAGRTAYRVVARSLELPIEPGCQARVATAVAASPRTDTAKQPCPQPIETGGRPRASRTAYRVVAQSLELPIQPGCQVRVATAVAPSPWTGTTIPPCPRPIKTSGRPRAGRTAYRVVARIPDLPIQRRCQVRIAAPVATA